MSSGKFSKNIEGVFFGFSSIFVTYNYIWHNLISAMNVSIIYIYFPPLLFFGYCSAFLIIFTSSSLAFICLSGSKKRGRKFRSPVAPIHGKNTYEIPCVDCTVDATIFVEYTRGKHSYCTCVNQSKWFDFSNELLRKLFVNVIRRRQSSIEENSSQK